jgi:hypothetical protein
LIAANHLTDDAPTSARPRDVIPAIVYRGEKAAA